MLEIGKGKARQRRRRRLERGRDRAYEEWDSLENPKPPPPPPPPPPPAPALTIIEIGAWASSSFFSLKTKTATTTLLLPPPLLIREGIKTFSIFSLLRLQILLLLLLHLYQYSDARTQLIFSPELNPQSPSVRFCSSSLFFSSPSPLLSLPPLALPPEDIFLSFLPLQFLIFMIMTATINSGETPHLPPCHMHCKAWELCTEEGQKP